MSGPWAKESQLVLLLHGAGGDREWMDRKDLSNKDVAKALRLSDGRGVPVISIISVLS
jgi:predicted esterase